MARPDKLPKILTEAETDRLLGQPNLRYSGSHRDYLFMRLMLRAGLRVSEATSLRPQHIDLMRRNLSVREGKGAKDCTLWVEEEVLKERPFDECRSETVGSARSPRPYPKSRSQTVPPNLIFVAPSLKPTTPPAPVNFVSEAFERALRAAGRPDLSTGRRSHPHRACGEGNDPRQQTQNALALHT